MLINHKASPIFKVSLINSRDQKEPKPLAFFSEDEDEKIDWIASRIREIYIAHGRMIPSIAIFLFNNHETFTKKLNNHNAILDDGLNVVYCRDGQVLGDKNSVRVFPIEYIKGLEFEAAFFHNIDEFQNQNIDDDLLIRYMYVGLSRATFYLGVTGVEGLPQGLAGSGSHFNSDDWKI